MPGRDGIRDVLAVETILPRVEAQADIRYYLTRCNDAPEV